MRTSEVNTVISSIWDAGVCLPMLIQRAQSQYVCKNLKEDTPTQKVIFLKLPWNEAFQAVTPSM